MDRPSEGAFFRRICFFPKDSNLHAGIIHLNNFCLIFCCKKIIAPLSSHDIIMDVNMQLQC